MFYSLGLRSASARTTTIIIILGLVKYRVSIILGIIEPEGNGESERGSCDEHHRRGRQSQQCVSVVLA